MIIEFIMAAQQKMNRTIIGTILYKILIIAARILSISILTYFPSLDCIAAAVHADDKA